MISDELSLLDERAEAARQEARRLWEENGRWRDQAARQLELMLEIGAEFRRCRR